MLIYKNEAGDTMTQELLKQAAEMSGMSINQYANSLGYKLVEEEQTVIDPGKELASATQSASAGPKQEIPTQALDVTDSNLENTLSDSLNQIDTVDTPEEAADPKGGFGEMDEKRKTARAGLRAIEISPEVISNIEKTADIPIEIVDRELVYNAKLDKMLPTGNIISTTYEDRYKDYIQQAKVELANASDNEYDVYNVPEEKWRERARNMYINKQQQIEMERQAEDVLEEYEKDVFGSWFSWARVKKLAKGITPTTALSLTDEEVEYLAGRAILTSEFEKESKEATATYNSTVDQIGTYANILETTSTELNDLQFKFNNDPASITNADKLRYNELANTQSTAGQIYNTLFDKLGNMQGASDKADILADMTKRTYSNLDVATNRMTGAVVRTMAGLGSVAYELSPQQLIKRTTGYDVNADEDSYLPMFLQAIAPAGSKNFKSGVDALYGEVEKIENQTKKRQELGQIKSVEDFGEFMLDLFSEQAVNSAITIGTGPAGLIAVSAAAGGNKFNDMDLEMAHDPDLKISAFQFYGAGVLYGASEFFTEKVSLGQAMRGINYLKFGKNNFKKAVKGTKSFNIDSKFSLDDFSNRKAILDYGINVNKEGGAELLAQLGNNATDRWLLDKDVALTDGLGEAYLTGSIMSGLGFQAPILAGDIYRAFNGTSEITKLNDRSKRLLDIRKQMETITTNMPKEGDVNAENTLNILQKEADGLIIENLKSKKLNENRIDELSNNDKRTLLDIDAETFKLKRGIDKLNQNPNLGMDQKRKLIADLQGKIMMANSVKDVIIANSTSSKAVQKQNNQQVQYAAENNLKFKAINVTTQEQAYEKAAVELDNKIAEIESSGELTEAKKKQIKEIKAVKSAVKDATDNGRSAGMFFGAEAGVPIAISVGETLAANGLGATILHETAHATLFKKLFEGNADIVGLVSSFESYMSSNFKGAKQKFAEVEAKYPVTEFSAAEIAEEKLATMLEYTYNVDMNADRTFSKKVVDQFRKIVPRSEVATVNNGQDVFKVLQSFARGFDKGEITGLADKVLKGNVKAAQTEAKKQAKKSKIGFSLKSAKENLGKIDGKDLKGVKAQTDIAMELPGMALAQVLGRFNLSPQVASDMRDAVVEKIYLAQETTKWDGRGQLYGFINGRIALRIKDIVREEYNKPKEERMFLSSVDGLQAEDQKDLATPDPTPVTKKADKPKYRKLKDSNVISGETLSKIKSKVVSATRVLKSKLDTKVSLNKTVTPLIAEIKKTMGKQADIDLKTAMGGKKDGKLQKFLLKNKKAILENMTTTWLMQAMPGAVQKQVDGKFTTEWQGKKIDRESVETDSAGRTAGADLVRRLPNVAANLSDEVFLSYILDAKGNPIRGRKESLAKAMSEEISLELFEDAINDPNSDITKAFEKNQGALGVVLAESYVSDVTRQVERGNIKFSQTLGNKGPKVIAEFTNEFNSDGFKNRFTTIWNEGKSDNPFRDSIIEHFGYYPIEGLTKKEIKKIAIDFSKDFTFNKKEIGVERVIITEGIEKTLDYIIKQSIGKTTRGTSYNDAQRLIDGEVSKLDLKEIKGINEGRRALKKLSYELIKQGFTGNQVYSMLSYSFGPAGIGGFEGALGADGKTRAVPLSDIITEAELGKKKFNKKTGNRENRGALVINEADFIQNFLPKDVNMGEKVSLRGESHKKDFYTKPTSTFNKLSNKDKKAYAREIYKLGEVYQKNIIEIAEAIHRIDISSAAQRELITGNFASMTATGKLGSAVRWYPAKLDGTLITFGELVKLFGRKTGDVGVFEHTKPANRIAVASYIYSLTGSKADLKILETELQDYDTAMITQGMDDRVREMKLQEMMGANYEAGKSVMSTRYVELINDMQAKGITFWDAKTNQTISPAGALGPQLNREMEKNFVPVKTEQKAVNNANSIKFSQTPKKIRVFDFDDTLARTKSNVLYTMPDGSSGKIDAATFAKDAAKMEADGAQWDFSEFSKVMNGSKGPLFEVAKIIADKRGTKDVFVLTARPADAAGPIQEFLSELGLNIPLENITGLGNGTPKAKADWIVGKVSEGYNDFYFADDHTGNVKAVKEALDNFDVKGKVQQAKIKFSNTLDKNFNDMIERQTGTESFKVFSKGVAQRRGKKVGKFKFFVSPSAEDFRGLTQYKFAGKGKQGEADQRFFEQALMDPYFKGVAALETARETIKNDTKDLFKMFKPVKKKLNKLVPGIDLTYDTAVRVFLWNKAGIEIPGLTERDNKRLNDVVANDAELSAFADGLLLVSKQDTWPAPSEYWESQTTLSDLNTLTEKTNRKEFLKEFIENVDIIFSEKNLNKVEALYGKASRTAIENSIFAMKTGSNSPNQNGDPITSKWLQWVNNSIGTIMFFNRRSALLQLTSATNFLNWSDNNPAKAALAFANQPQYWKDWAMIFNSDKLKQRRSGLKSDVQESEIANAAKNTEDKIGAIIAYLLKIGFAPTQIADSIAIASGGATFYRNRVNSLKKQGLSVAEAEAQAFEDLSKLSDEAQQSGDPALVSQQQRSVAGRLILSFQNTTMQYTRLMKKAGQDLINRRGDPKTHVSKILYYGALQNLIFNALSKTAFALIPGFDEEEDEDEVKRDEKLEKKSAEVLNGMTDSIIRGTGIYGAIVTTMKNAYLTWKREDEKGFKGDQTKTILEVANISPAIGSKLRKIYSAIQGYQFDKDVIEKHPWDVTIDGKFNPSPTYSIIGNVASAALNLPLDRALAEARGVAEMFDNRNSEMQRIALGLGWRTWNVGADNEEFDLIKNDAKTVRKTEGKQKAKETRARNTLEKRRRQAAATKAFWDDYNNEVDKTSTNE